MTCFEYIPVGILFVVILVMYIFDSFFFLVFLFTFIILYRYWSAVATIIHIRRKRVATADIAGVDIFVHTQIRVFIFIFVVSFIMSFSYWCVLKKFQIFAICFTIFEWRFQIEAENVISFAVYLFITDIVPSNATIEVLLD